MLKNTFSIISIIKQELIIVLMLAVFCKMYFEQKPLSISSDGKGYYEYLPAIFIYNDIHWDYLDTLITEKYIHKEYSEKNNINGHKVNRYFVGTAIMMAPFFGLACLYDSYIGGNVDGYSTSFQVFIYYSALFYLWLGLLYLRKFLHKLKINKTAILFSLLSVVFATPIVYYSYFRPAYSHIFSFAVISAFMYYSYCFYEKKENKHFMIMMIAVGLIIIIRPINILIILIVPFYFKSFKEFISFFKKNLIKSPLYKLFSVLVFFLIVFIQLFMYYLQTGSFFVYSYGDATFNFLSPEIINVLFSYHRGLFVYTPILLFLLIGGGIVLIRKKQFYKFTVLALLLSVLTYVISSWSYWDYGMSFGQRSFIELLPVFAIFSAYFFNYSKIAGKIIATLLLVCCMGINLIQTDQYSRYIFNWERMNKEFYWKIFLKTEKKYEGLIWKEKYEFTKNQIVQTIHIKEQKRFPANSWNKILNISQDSLNISPLNFNLIQVKGDINIGEGNPQIYCSVTDSAGNNFWIQQNAFCGIEQDVFYKENTLGQANYFFKINVPKSFYTYNIGLITKENIVVMKNCQINFIQL